MTKLFILKMTDVAISGVVTHEDELFILNIFDDGTFVIKPNETNFFEIFTNDEHVNEDVVKSLRMLMDDYKITFYKSEEVTLLLDQIKHIALE